MACGYSNRRVPGGSWHPTTVISRYHLQHSYNKQWLHFRKWQFLISLQKIPEKVFQNIHLGGCRHLYHFYIIEKNSRRPWGLNDFSMLVFHYNSNLKWVDVNGRCYYFVDASYCQQHKLFFWSLEMRRHLSKHLLCSVFQSSYTLHITS